MPVPQQKAFQEIQRRFVREQEKKFSEFGKLETAELHYERSLDTAEIFFDRRSDALKVLSVKLFCAVLGFCM